MIRDGEETKVARNAIQMQKGLSLTELHEQFGTEEKCSDLPPFFGPPVI